MDADYYLLTPEVFGIDQWWVCQFHDPVTQSGVLQVVRNEKAPSASLILSLKGVTAKRLAYEDLYTGRHFEGGPTVELVLKPGTATVFTYSLKR